MQEKKEAAVLAVGSREAARLLGVCERTLWSWSKAGIVRTVKIGRRVLYPVAGLKELLGQGEESTVNKVK